MKISANYTIFYGADFIEYSLRSIYDHVDYILIALGKKSWKNHEGRRFSPIDNTKEVIMRFIKENDPESKITLFEGEWDSDTEQRNFILDKCRGLVDYAMLVDSDEVWEKKEIEKLVREVKENSLSRDPPLVYGVGIVHYYRSLYWSHSSQGPVNYVYKVTPALTHRWIRHPQFDRTDVQVLQLPVKYHHYGYAYPSKIVEKKVKFWGHSGDVVEDWYEDIFLKWKPSLPAYSPAGQNWTDLKRKRIIPEMADHPFREFEIIP